jgi:uncharacterized protein (DUF433 family)
LFNDSMTAAKNNVKQGWKTKQVNYLPHIFFGRPVIANTKVNTTRC